MIWMFNSKGIPATLPPLRENNDKCITGTHQTVTVIVMTLTAKSSPRNENMDIKYYTEQLKSKSYMENLAYCPFNITRKDGFCLAFYLK